LALESNDEAVPPSMIEEEEEGDGELGGFKSTNLKHLSSIRTPSIPTQTVIFNKFQTHYLYREVTLLPLITTKNCNYLY